VDASPVDYAAHLLLCDGDHLTACLRRDMGTCCRWSPPSTTARNKAPRRRPTWLSWFPTKPTPAREVFLIRILILFRAPQRYGNNTRFDEIESREKILDLRQVTEG
jgi:hypothetical protein